MQEFSHPDVESPEKATAVALGETRKAKAKQKAPPPGDTSITVLNGNGVTGSASTASYLLSQRGYSMIYPPDGKPANAPNWDFFQTRIAYDPKQPGGKEAARKVATLFGSEDVIAADARARRALERGDAHGRRRPDLPRLDRGGADRQDAEAAAAERRARRRGVARAPAGARRRRCRSR